MYWNDLNSRLKAEYGCKVYKLALSSGCSCPNRDGTLDTRGCIFCDGAGAFAEAGAIPDQLAAARLRVAAKAGTDAKYIAYFQSFTNTYGDADRLRALYQAAMAPEDVVILSIATRPDCLGPDILGLLEELNRIKPVWVELGLQTIHPESARYLRRGYDLPVFDRAVKVLKAIGVTVIVHQILGLPGETPEMMAETARYIGQSGAEGENSICSTSSGTRIWRRSGRQAGYRRWNWRNIFPFWSCVCGIFHRKQSSTASPGTARSETCWLPCGAEIKSGY